MPSGLVVGSLLDVAAAAIFTSVGILLVRRHHPREARVPGRMFGVWWGGLAALTLTAGPGVNGGALALLAWARGIEHVGGATILVFAILWILFACMALWGLLAYLIYLFSGRDVTQSLAVGYAALFAFFAWVAVQEAPQRLADATWGVTVAYERPLSGPALAALLAFLELPQIGGAIAYATLYPKAGSRAGRYRIGLVSGALVVWLGFSLTVGVLQVNSSPPWLLTARLLGLASALTILSAYVPPPGMRAWLARNPLDDHERRDRLRARVQELV